MRISCRLLPLSLLCLLGALAATPVTAAQPFTAYHEDFYPPGLVGSPGQEAWFGRAADLDGDGRDELITGRWDISTGKSILTVRRYGAGLWDPPTVSSHDVGLSAWTPGLCEVADLDNDGWLDLAVPMYDTLAILPGTAPLTFGAAIHVPIPGITAVAIGDFDLDGTRDFAVTRYNSNEVQTWRGTGSFGFTLDDTYVTHNGTGEISVTDLDGNAAPDLVVGDATVSIAFVGDGAGGFTLIDIGAAYAQPCGDLNGDGNEDVLAATSTLLGNGDGTFQAPQPYLPALVVARTADLDEDGKLDLVGRRAMTPNHMLSVQKGSGNGQFGIPSYLAWWSGQPEALAIGDFDGDGHLDVASPGRSVEPDAIYYGRGNGTFLAPRQIALTSPPLHVASGTLGGDSRPDLVVTSRAANSMSVLLSTGLGSWAPADTVVLPGTPGGRRIAVGDLNADGRDDIVLGYSNLASISYWLTQANGLPGSRTDLTTPAVGTADLQVADLDNDLVPDILWLGTPAGPTPIQWYRGLGGGSFAAAQALSVSGTHCFIAADLSGDGIQDLAVAPGNHDVTVAIASTPGVFPSPVTHSWFSFEPPLTVPFQQIVSGDFDGDPYLDLALQGSVGLIRLHGLGGGAFASPTGIGASATGGNTYCPAGDLDGDGVDELVSGGPVSFRLRVLKFTSGGSLVTNPILGVSAGGSGGVTFALADVDGNGTQDIVSALARRPWLDLLLNRTPPEVLGVQPPAVGTGGLALAPLADPARETIAFRLASTLNASVRVELLDLQGRRIRSAIVRPNPGAATTVSLGRVTEVPAGLYFVRARQGAGVATARISVVH